MAIGSRGPVGELAPEPDSMIGRVLGHHYRVVERIGVGGMGIVYVVEHTHLRKRFAAKVLAADLARQPEAIARFEVEAHSASQLDHENIVSVIDYGVGEDGTVYLIMELLRGQTLAQRSARGGMTLDELVALIVPVCRALATAHAAGIVHRDMKPDNVFLTERGLGRPVVKVLDFGISKARQSSLRDGRITKQGQVLGSPEYMSPEAARGEEVDSRADVYAVGVMLYELATGQVPFRSDNYLKVLQMHVGSPPTPPTQLNPDLPPALERVILNALQKDPDERYGSVEELEVELLAALPDVAERALYQPSLTPRASQLPSGSIPIVPIPTPVGATSPTDTAEIPRPSRRGRWIALGAVAIAAAIAVPLFVLGGDDRTAAPERAAPTADTPASNRVAAAETETATPAAARPAPAAPAAIRFLVTTRPAGATVRVDGREVGTTPVDVQLPAAIAPSKLTIELDGHHLEERTVSLDHDVQLELALVRIKTNPAAQQTPRGRPKMPRPRPTARPASPPPDHSLDIKTDR